eukprot:gb/GEZJ01005180.1/.p2 GENE.gb/GEZJ01005180.1/~~gb/GEZJ01005180.1/.p2  ORF type:complete len:115 (+),score=12.51 gb/GEZJ01005180.1/:1093-1437(+)
MELKHDCNAFFKHAMNVSDSFKEIDNGPVSRSSTPHHRRDGKYSLSEQRKVNTEKVRSNYDHARHIHAVDQTRPCPNPPSKKNGARHWVDDCKECSGEEYREFKAEFVAKKTTD